MDMKKLAGDKAAEYVKDGMVVGLGTGSTAYHMVNAVGEMVTVSYTHLDVYKRQGINLTCVTTPKFKRAVLRAMLVLPLGGEDAALRACLPQVLRRGCLLYTSIRHDPLIGDFKSPLYTKYGSGETTFRYPNVCLLYTSRCV